jgi:hypothetical protein
MDEEDGLAEQPAGHTDSVRDLSRGSLTGVVIEFANTLVVGLNANFCVIQRKVVMWQRTAIGGANVSHCYFGTLLISSDPHRLAPNLLFG